MKIKNKRRFILSSSIILIIIISIFNLCLAKTEKIKVEEYEEYMVQGGDTLWSIATNYKRPGQDIREYIYNLQDLNNIDTMIFPGQVIKIIK